MHVTVNFWGFFFWTDKIFFGLTRFSCLSVRMTDNFSANFGKSVLYVFSLYFQPEIYPGSCWAFQGSQGYIIIELSTIIKPTAFTLEHVPKSLTPDGKITSAPKDFLVLVSLIYHIS